MTPSPFSLVLYLKEIYLFDAILPSFGIHQVKYLSRDQKKEGDREREEGEKGGCYDMFTLTLRWRCESRDVEGGE